MIGWILVSFPLFIILGRWYSKKKGGLYGLFVWLAIWLVINIIVLFSYEVSSGILLACTLILSALFAFYIKWLLLKIEIGKRFLVHDHGGIGCMTLTIVFIITAYFLRYILCRLFLL